MLYSYEDAVRYIEEVPRFTTKNGPEHTKELLRRLGNPGEDMRIIHVAGTNGKGSVCAFLEAFFRAGGQRTGLFTSPHLVSVNERFQIDRQNVDRETFTRAFRRVKETVDHMAEDGLAHPTYFELLFAMGMVIFEEARVDILILETGLGGRLDATNVIRRPLCCVITSISRDHTEYLGDTIPEIAGEKAGIIKPGVPVVYDARDEAAARVIRERAAALHSPAIPLEREAVRMTSWSEEGIDFVLNNKYYCNRSVRIPFCAPYQTVNCALALTALRAADPEGRIDGETAAAAAASVRWSGRMERVLPGVVLDGAHNEDGIRQFLQTVRFAAEKGPVSLLFAAVSDKNYREMIREICEAASYDSIVVTSAGGSRRVGAEIFAQIFSQHTDAPVLAEENAEKAFEKALSLRPEGGVLFAAGSLYLIGELEALCARRATQAE